MPKSKSIPIEMVCHAEELSAAARELDSSKVIALDTESNSRHHYPEQLCLIQIASLDKIYIIDTLSAGNLSPLRNILADASVRKVIHSADYDIRCLDRHSGLRIRNLSDPSIAARFAGITQYGLASLIKDLLGITIDKSKHIQKSDWGRRPLPTEAISYAANDVRYLITLQQELDQKLRILGREAWVTEEYARIERVRYNEPNLETAYLSVKGSKDLNGQELAIFQKLVLFREEEARHQCRPPYFILSDATLIFLAANPRADLSQLAGFGQTGLKRFGNGLRKALEKGLNAPPIYRPPRIRTTRNNEEEVQRLNRLKGWRALLGSSLSLDPSLIWSLASLERLAKMPDTVDIEGAHDSIRDWQRQVVAPSLQTFLKTMVTDAEQ
ncbi:MAG: ribonuclease D [Chloroflexi bacterium]|nr:ribonuclease D [Chloroflexota bacterium]